MQSEDAFLSTQHVLLCVNHKSVREHYSLSLSLSLPRSHALSLSLLLAFFS